MEQILFDGQELSEDFKTKTASEFREIVLAEVQKYKNKKQMEFTALKILPEGFSSIEAVKYDVMKMKLELNENKVIADKNKNKKKKGLKQDLSKKITPKDIAKEKSESEPTLSESTYTFRL